MFFFLLSQIALNFLFSKTYLERVCNILEPVNKSQGALAWECCTLKYMDKCGIRRKDEGTPGGK